MDTPGLFGDWLKARRKALDLTQEELASRTGCSIFALRKIESGERRPSKQLAALLADKLELPEEDRQTFVRVARGEMSPDRLRPASASAAHLSSPAHPPPIHPLPLPPTPILGRQSELAALERLFRDPECRLLTLTGMGGIGKTRLAIEFAARHHGLFRGGVYYAPLASINSTQLVAPTIAEAMEYAFSGPVDPTEQLIGYLRSMAHDALLLVLDNFEHLLLPDSTATDLVNELLERVPHLKILVTSRERLDLRGEWMYELHGLPVPPTDYVDRLDEFSAAALFLQSARRIKIDFELAKAERPALVRICQLLEGIPLALELAAAWVSLLSCTEIAREIESSIDFLQTRMRDIPERHRSLRASFEHSWKLLSEAERSVLRRLAVFRGGFDRSAAGQVAGATLPVMAALVSKSLVRRGDDGRYDLHEVIRQSVLSHLDPESTGHQQARDAHSRYYLQFAAERERALRSAGQPQAVRALLDEMDNVRAAWIWAIRREMFAELGACVRSLAWFFEVTGLVREGIDQFEPLVRALRARPPSGDWRWLLGHTLTHQGMLYFRRGLFDRAQAQMEESLSILRSLGKQDYLTDVLVYLSIILHLNGDMQRSRALMGEGFCCAQAASNEWFLAYAIFNLGYLDSLEGEYAEGYRQMLEGVAIWRKLGDPHSISLGLNHLAPTLVELGRYRDAESGLQESLSLCKESGNRWGTATGYRYLGLVKMAQGKLDEAVSLFQTSIETFGDYFTGWDIAKSWVFLAEAILRSGDLEEAQRAHLQALRLSREAESIPLMLDALTGLAELSLRGGDYARAFATSSYVASHAASVQESRDRANEIRKGAERQLAGGRNGGVPEGISNLSLERLVSLYLEHSGE